MRFPVTDVAFEGFRLTREKPALVLAGGVLLGLNGVASSLIAAALAGDALRRAQALLEDGAQPTDPAFQEAVIEILPASGLAALVLLLVLSVIGALVFRAVLTDRRSRASLPADVARVAGVTLLTWALLLAINLLIGMALGALGALTGGQQAALQATAALATLIAAVVVAVRLSAAGPMSVDEGRFRFRPSFALTRGRFWPLFGAYFLAAVLATVVAVLGGLVLSAVFAFVPGAGGLGAAARLQAQPVNVQEALEPARLAYVLLSGLPSGLAVAILLSAPAAAYRVLKRTA
jgi:hypothetical protein